MVRLKISPEPRGKREKEEENDSKLGKMTIINLDYILVMPIFLMLVYNVLDRRKHIAIN